MKVTFDIFYNKMKEKVINLLKNKEIAEGDLCFDKIVGEVAKELMINDGDIKRKIVKQKEERPDINVLYRDDSKNEFTTKIIERRLNKK